MTWINNLYRELVLWLGDCFDVNSWSGYVDSGDAYECFDIILPNLIMVAILVIISALVFSVFKIITSVIMRCIDDTYN